MTRRTQGGFIGRLQNQKDAQKRYWKQEEDEYQDATEHPGWENDDDDVFYDSEDSLPKLPTRRVTRSFRTGGARKKTRRTNAKRRTIASKSRKTRSRRHGGMRKVPLISRKVTTSKKNGYKTDTLREVRASNTKNRKVHIESVVQVTKNV